MTAYHTHGSFSGFRPALFITPCVKIIALINIAVFILVHIGRMLGIPLLPYIGLTPFYISRYFMIWQLVTYLFVHAGLMHLVLNMLMLVFFASPLEDIWGKKRFLSFFFFTGIGAGLCAFIAGWSTLNVTVGISGVIFGFLVAHAVLFPESIILIFFLFPMKMKHAAWFFAGINVLGMLSSPDAGVSYMAHLGGGLFGFLFLKYEWIEQKCGFIDPSSVLDNMKRSKEKRDQKKKIDLKDDVDRILDKISREGLHSLTKKEKAILDKRSSRK